MYRKSDGTWNKSGKVYDTLGKLRALITTKLNSHNNYSRYEINDWEVIEYEVTVKEVKQLHEIVAPEKIFALLKK